VANDDLIQAIANELAKWLDDQPFDTLETDRRIRLYGAASRVVGYLENHYQLAPLPPEG